tara:strand:+ start:326 stop:796 length:471 start_codon:yes stop_codon:yes gene_type:complete
VIAHTKSRQEKSLVSDLLTGGIACYLPVLRELRSHGARKRWVDMPLFPGYVFVRGGRDVGAVARRTGRVANMIPVGDQAQLVHELRQIRCAIEAGGRLASSAFLEAGVPARIARGPLKGVEGVVESVASPERLILLIRTLGRATSVEVAPGDVERL